MNYWLALLSFMLLLNCTPGNKEKENHATEVTAKKKYPVFKATEITADTNLFNTSSHRVFILYNSADHYLERTDTSRIYFTTECMVCLPAFPYNGHLVFGGRLELTADGSNQTAQDISLPGTDKLLSMYTGYWMDKPRIFAFSSGRGKIIYSQQACTDSDYYEVELKYPDGVIRLKNVLNAAMFEYDLDKDGRPEQFIRAVRNCDQELTILRIL